MNSQLPNTEQQDTAPTTPSQDKQEKQGRSCFGCLCDMRRAVVILSALSILLNSVAIVTNKFVLFDKAQEDIAAADDDDDMDNSSKRIDDLFRIYVILSCVGMVGYLGAIVGGIKFYQPFVKVNIVLALTVFIVQNVLFFNAASDVEEFDYVLVNMSGPLVGIIMSLYVQISFVKEMHYGIMSPENYPNEEQSCCCV
jgi:hypothetical protein